MCQENPLDSNWDLGTSTNVKVLMLFDPLHRISSFESDLKLSFITLVTFLKETVNTSRVDLKFTWGNMLFISLQNLRELPAHVTFTFSKYSYLFFRMRKVTLFLRFLYLNFRSGFVLNERSWIVSLPYMQIIVSLVIKEFFLTLEIQIFFSKYP